MAETGSTSGLNRRCSGSKSQRGRGCHAQQQTLAACGQPLCHCRLPAFKGDELAEQAQALANRAYEEAAQRLPGQMRELEFAVPGGAPVTGFLHMPEGEGPFPTVLMCGGLDSLQIDYYSLYERYFAPKGIAMLTLDMPSIGFSSKWKLTQDSSLLHQHALKALENIPWVDHTRVAAFGFRFGANVAVRLAYLESSRLKAVACLGPVVHALLSDPARQGACPKCTLMCWPAVLACMMHQTKRCALSSIATR